MPDDQYVIDGGCAGRDRLRLLARVMQPSTEALLARVGVQPGTTWLDAGCGGGDVSRLLARAVGPHGSVLGVDADTPQLELARQETAAAGMDNVEFQSRDLGESGWASRFDGLYMRFVLTHVRDPQRVLTGVVSALRTGGIAVVEDIDFRGHFCHPDSRAFRRYLELYTATVLRRGADPNIGPRLPSLLANAGCRDVNMQVVQPAGRHGDVKLVAAITMERIRDHLIGDRLASAEEVDEIVRELYALAEDAETVMSLPRVVQAWGQRAA